MSALNHYKNYLSKWPKTAGPKPTVEQVEQVHAAGCRAGSKAALAASMYMRKDGATSQQVTAVVGSPQLNVRRFLINRGMAKAVPMPHDDKGHTVYKLTLQSSKKTRKTKSRKSKDTQETQDTGSSEQVSGESISPAE
jgi:hypothetical protein